VTTAKRTAKQNKSYWALVNRLPHLVEDENNRRAITINVTGKISTRDLTVTEMNALCDYLEFLLGEKRLEDVEFPNRISHRQRSEISRLERDLGWYENPARLEGFLLRQTGGRTKNVAELTRIEAQKVLNGLKFIAIREKQAHGAASR